MKTEQITPFGIMVYGSGSMALGPTVLQLKKMVAEHQIVVLRGFDSFVDSDQFAKFGDEWGQVSLWPFGKVLELIEQSNAKDHIFANSYVPMHWDGMYRKSVPEYQIFHCARAPEAGSGGRTVFTNTQLMIENMSVEELELCKRAQVTYKRKMEYYDSVTTSPIVTRHPYNGSTVLRFNEPHEIAKGDLLNPVEVQINGLSEQDQKTLMGVLSYQLYSDKNIYAHEWQNGDVVISDNFTLLHGREAFRSNSCRHIQRIQIESSPVFENPHLDSYL